MWLAVIAIKATAALTIEPAALAAPPPAGVLEPEKTTDRSYIDSLIDEAQRLRIRGDNAAATSIWRKILIYTETIFGPHHPNVAICLNRIAELLMAKGHYKDAENLYRRSLGIYKKALKESHPDATITAVARTTNELAIALSSQGDIQSATPLLRQALETYEESLGRDHPAVASVLNNLALNLRTQGQYALAEPLFRRSLSISENSLGPDHPDLATSLNNLALLLQNQGQYDSAEPLYRRSLTIYEKALGPNHPDVATSLNNLAILLAVKGQHSAAEPLFRRSLIISEKTLGPDHPAVATSLGNLANCLHNMGFFGEAEQLYQQSLTIQEKSLGPNHPDLAVTLNNIGTLLDDNGNYRKAESLYRRSLRIYERALGPDHPDVATSLNNIAQVLVAQGKFTEAELLYRRSLDIRERVLKPNHSDVAMSLNNLAQLLSRQGQYSAAERLYRRSLEVNEKALGQNHPHVAINLNNIARLLADQGQFTGAAQLYRRALVINEKALGPNHPDIAINLNNLAKLLIKQGQHSAAELLYRRSMIISEESLSPNHPNVAVSIDGIAHLLADQGEFAEAESLYQRSLRIREQTLGPNHPDVAVSLNNLAGLLDHLGKHARSEKLYQRSLSIQEEALGRGHPDISITLNNLAELLRIKGNYAAAETLYRRSLTISKQALGPDHPDNAVSLANLAALLNSQGRHSEAAELIERSEEIETTWLLRELPLLPAQVRSAQLDKLGRGWEFIFQLIDVYPQSTPLALETRLNRQGLLPEIEQRQALLLNAPSIERIKVEQLRALTQQLASVALPTDRRTEVRKLRDKLQEEIYRQLPALEFQLITSASVAKALPADGALVEFQRYQPFDGSKPRDQNWGAAQYIALVLKPDASITSVPLGLAATIDSKVHKSLRATADGLSDADAIWAELSDQVLKPLVPHLNGSRQWFLSPDGELNRVPFAALPAPQQPSTSLAKAVQLRLLTTGRELVKLLQPTPNGSASLVMANPNYNRLGAKPTQASKGSDATIGAQQRSPELGSSQWKQLPASEREGQKVAKLLGTGLISGSSATTNALQRRQGPRVLHVATHGFFVADQETKPTEPMRAIQEGSTLLGSLRQEDPQLRSGLVFAGANQPDVDPKDDGYLTAAEAVNLNLKGTELVVLSACSTGQGEVQTGEGVYGLQRSLTVAGARSTLLSLWKVDDDATAEFMERFYQRLKAGEGRSDALAAVQDEFRSGKVQSPNGAEWKEPYYWAAWQLVGDWRPIKGL